MIVDLDVCFTSKTKLFRFKNVCRLKLVLAYFQLGSCKKTKNDLETTPEQSYSIFAKLKSVLKKFGNLFMLKKRSLL